MQFRPIRSDDEYTGQHWDGMVTVGTAVASRPPFPVGPTNMTLKGQQFARAFAFPNFYFHGILRHNGVEVGKPDFLGVS
jgi:hypothetical protein